MLDLEKVGHIGVMGAYKNIGGHLGLQFFQISANQYRIGVTPLVRPSIVATRFKKDHLAPCQTVAARNA